jgi:hypothetical protein
LDEFLLILFALSVVLAPTMVVFLLLGLQDRRKQVRPRSHSSVAIYD